MTPSALAPTSHLIAEPSFWARIRKIERRQWWLWASAISVTLLLTVGVASFSFLFEQTDPGFSFALRQSVRGLLGLVFLFDLYTIYQQLLIHRIRRQLAEQELMFRLITENAEDLITVADREGHHLYDSPGYGTLGYSREELHASVIPEAVHPDDRAALISASRETFEKGSGPRVEYRFRRKDGEWRILESTRSPVRNSRGEIEKVVIVSRDITERKQAEEQLRRRDEQLRQSQKMEAVGRLSGGIAHDFNNLLGVIIGYSELLESQLAPGDPLRKSAEEIHKAGGRASSLTQQLLAFSRQQALQPQVLDLNALVADMGTMLRRLIGPHIELITDLATGFAPVKGEKSQLEQVIVNLVVNARDAMPDGGIVKIETSNLDLDERLADRFPVLPLGSYVLLTVSDTGIGMDAETRRHIFEPFFTTKGPGRGTGLGLATVYGVVKQSGGEVLVESVPGQGSTFQIFLPRTDESAVANDTREKLNPASTSSGTILVVDDEEALLTLTAGRLKDCGYTVLEARDGEMALEMERTFPGSIDLLLTDIMMPRMNGLALARNISKSRPEIRIAFMTGHAGREASVQDDQLDGAETLRKPFSYEQLIALVRRALEPRQIPI